MAVYRLVECKKGADVGKIEVLSTDDSSKTEVFLVATILSSYVEDNGAVFSREELLHLIKDNGFYLYDLLVNQQKEVIELTVNRLCDNGCLIEHRRFISQDKL